jgi:hypothetical protein
MYWIFLCDNQKNVHNNFFFVKKKHKLCVFFVINKEILTAGQRIKYELVTTTAAENENVHRTMGVRRQHSTALTYLSRYVRRGGFFYHDK